MELRKEKRGYLESQGGQMDQPRPISPTLRSVYDSANYMTPRRYAKPPPVLTIEMLSKMQAPKPVFPITLSSSSSSASSSFSRLTPTPLPIFPEEVKVVKVEVEVENVEAGLDETILVEDEDEDELTRDVFESIRIDDTYKKEGDIAIQGNTNVGRYLSRSTSDLVAIKKITVQSRHGFPVNTLHEISIQKNTDHPNIVKILDIVVNRDGNIYNIYIVQELMEMDLYKYIQMNGRSIDRPMRMLILQSILKGLEHIHLLGYIHNDIKSMNVLISGNTIKIADFGVAKKQLRTGTKMNPFYGTPAYFAPEKIVGRGDITPAVDIWAVGCIACELRTGGTMLFNIENWRMQLMAIFDILGYPDESFYIGAIRKFNIDATIIPPRGLGVIFNDETLEDVTETRLIESMLTVIPADRPSALRLLQQFK